MNITLANERGRRLLFAIIKIYLRDKVIKKNKVSLQMVGLFFVFLIFASKYKFFLTHFQLLTSVCYKYNKKNCKKFGL